MVRSVGPWWWTSRSANGRKRKSRSKPTFSNSPTMPSLSAAWMKRFDTGIKVLNSFTVGLPKRLSAAISGKWPMKIATSFEAAKKILLEEGSWSGEVRKLTKARREVVVASRWTLLRDGQGNPSSILAIDTDITEKRQMEAQFRAQRLELIGTLAGGIAHDLNNILQVIITNLDLAASAPAFDERLPKYLDDASQGAKRATNLARRLLTFSKGGAPLKQPLDVAEILTQAVLLALSGSKLKPHFAFQRDLYPVIGDPVQLTQVIENVVINACEATPQGGKLLVRAENVDEGIPTSSGFLPGGT